MRRQAKRATRPQLKPAVIAHIIPDWKAVPGTCPKALCGQTLDIPAGRPVVDAVSTQPDVIVCALCEAAQLLDGLPDPPTNDYTQPELF